jgi:hypothetical protein
MDIEKGRSEARPYTRSAAPPHGGLVPEDVMKVDLKPVRPAA